ncbi:6-cysteine protein, putative [Plasmodium malariae]|uniref:6-cysteine protein, putative n=1 Tax=Plasmodium malariae TaxID=5858 RepID=A0A1C3KYJ8_PLAMA|nr:6-cysteine protein, putative [Plasmodium malariae]
MNKVSYFLTILALLWSKVILFAKHLVKFDPVRKDEDELYIDTQYNCEYSGFIDLDKDFFLYYCFFIGEEDHNGLILRKFFLDELEWGVPSEVLLTTEKINYFIFIDDYIMNKLILIYSCDQNIRVTAFNNYIDPSIHTYKISINYDIQYKANIISKVTYFYKNRRALFICGINKNENILCTFSFDYGLTMKDDNSIEFILKKRIPLCSYKMYIKFKQDYVYFNLYDEINESNFYELKCIKVNEYEYTCDIVNKVIKETETTKYKYVFRNKIFQTIAFQKDNICYIGWSFNSLTLNNEINKQLSDVPCSRVSLFQRGQMLLVTYRKKYNEKDKDFYSVFENLSMKGTGCELRTGGSLYVMNTFVNNMCTVNMSNIDVNPTNNEEVSFSIVTPSRFKIGEGCFISNEMYENDKTSLYYLEEENVEEEQVTIYTFFFYRYILTYANFKGTTCVFESGNNKEKLNISLTLENYYREYECNISLDLCDFFIYNKSKIKIYFNENWIIDKEILKSNILYNDIYVSLYSILSQSNINEFLQVDDKHLVLTIPQNIPSSRTIKIGFTRVEDNTIKYAYIRLQRISTPVKKVLGINFSDFFDIHYKYYKYYQEKTKFLINEFVETTYIGMICQTEHEVTSTPCTLTLVDSSNKKIQIHKIFPKSVPFLYYYLNKKLPQSDSYINETRFVVFKNIGNLLEEKQIKYIYFRCICNTKNFKIDTTNQIDYIITNDKVSPDIIESHDVIESSNNSLSDDSNNFKNSTNKEQSEPIKTKKELWELTGKNDKDFNKNHSTSVMLDVFLLIVLLTIIHYVTPFG